MLSLKTFLSIHKPSIKEVTIWKNTSKCPSFASDRTLPVLLGALKLFYWKH
jgi:hypothetical protein